MVDRSDGTQARASAHHAGTNSTGLIPHLIPDVGAVIALFKFAAG
jgi:hypothetical protein